MPIATKKQAGSFVFEFDRIIRGVRFRRRRRLPKAWSRAQADQYDREEVARLYAIASGIERQQRTIDEAVAVYVADKPKLKSLKSAMQHMAATFPIWTGQPIESLPEVCSQISKQSKGLAPQTVKNRIAVLRAACRWAWKEHAYCEHDPGARVRVPEVDNERQVYRTRREVILMARSVRQSRDGRVAILAAFYSGMRLSELRRARAVGDVFELADTKNRRPRHVPIHPKIAVYTRKAWPLALSKRMIQRQFERAREALGVPETHFHDLRHSTASALIDNGADFFVVGQILGHADPRSTKRYTHLRTDRMAEVMRGLGKKSPNTKSEKAEAVAS